MPSPDSAPAPPSAPRRILLVDADAFFVAVARQVDPDGAGRADLLVVGGTPGSRGVVCSASYGARRYGVRSAMPIARAVRLCPQAMFVPVPRAACSRKSGEIARVLERFAPNVECASVDEWYLDLTGTEALYGGEPLADTAHRIRETVLAETGLTVSIGGGTSRMIAKLAVELGKPKPERPGSGVHVVAPGHEGEFMTRFELGDLPHIGPKFRDRLASVGLRTVLDVLPLDVPALARRVGAREAEWLHRRVRGIDDSPVEPREIPKSISREDTFETDLSRDADLDRELLRLVTRAAADLREHQLTARTITVRLRDADFRTRQASRTLVDPVIADRVIFETARALLRRLRSARRTPARLLGVGLSSLEVADESAPQLSLFESDGEAIETERDRALVTAIDRARARFGPKAIVPGRLSSR